jgi:hypothetical protein
MCMHRVKTYADDFFVVIIGVLGAIFDEFAEIDFFFDRLS